MEISLIQQCCNENQVLISQKQGENAPIIIIYPYDITDYTFRGTINFSPVVALSLGSGLSVIDIVSCTGSISNNILTVTAISLGEIYIGMPITGVGILPNTVIMSFDTGSGGIGTYIVSQGQTAALTTIAASRIALQLTSSQTQNVPEGQYYFDLWSISPAIPAINTDTITGYFTINQALTVIS